ncbi:hypothetical protein VSS74_19380 [Conexibacter stalactiti]|uniref:Carboxypeptidase regulatory-like domain-containing protein n=1 Tax=Conexibacter stalactiti TaxID=1940611 RepID=A0ABU4HTC0_9ACTN|nr:hypothetical protein [Conexibacter stalactiti]MDW5596518.1 hypothetical protein [Conexibacter stalactiti]MEC5037160.1 hypothetical protein [Conexibacter stalactiti]
MNRIIATGAAVVSVAVLVASLIAVLATSQAGAANRPTRATRAVINDCAGSPTGLLQNRYSARVLRLSLRRMSGDVREYTGCRDAIRQQLRRSHATIVAGIRRSAAGGRVKGRVTLLHRGRTVDALAVRGGRTVTFKVAPGTYALRADGRRRCTVRVVARQRMTLRASVVCGRQARIARA